MTAVLSVEVARREALFLANVSTGDHLNRTEMDAAIRQAVRSHGGTRGCAADMAREFGDYPDTAPERMRWARERVAATYPKRGAR